MSLFRWFTEPFRAWVKRRSFPLSVDEALERRSFYSKMYMISSFILSGYIMYIAFQDEAKENLSDVPAYQRIIKKLGITSDVRVVTLEGFTKKSDITYYTDPETLEIKSKIVTKASEDVTVHKDT